MQLSRVILNVRSPEELARFYIERLGMKRLGQEPAVVVGFGGENAAIELRQAGEAEGYEHRQNDRYWKIGITLPNVDIAYDQLIDAGVAVSRPRQFGEIGYMCHLSDPEGFVIELLQHRFEANRRDDEGDSAAVLGGGARIGQITLRTADLDAALAFYRDDLTMRLLSIQPVSAFGFTLYFLAFTEERPSSDDLEAVENREWLWQRPYTTLEFQHVMHSEVGRFARPDDGAPGYGGLVIGDAGDRAGQLIDDGGGAVYLKR